MKQLRPPRAVLEIADELENAGFETWCVGGAIRDALLGHPHLDWDLATSAKPGDVRQLFGHRRTIPVGVEFGTVGVLDRAGRMHEVTTFRRDVKTDGRHAEVEFGVSLDDDLARRDFTINAIAYSPRRNEVRDPFGGRADLERKIVRAVGDPEARMREDRLRALRAIRFAARFDFDLDAATRRAIEMSAPFLDRLSRERVKQELDKTMKQVRCPSGALATWKSTGAFRALIPPLDAVSAASFRVTDHLAMPGPSRRPARLAIRFAGLLLELSASEAVKVLTGLRSSRVEINLVSALIERWRTYGESLTTTLGLSAAPADVQVRRWVAGLGRVHIGTFLRLAEGVWASARAAGDEQVPTARAARSVYRRMLKSALKDAIDLGSLVIDGDDLRQAGIAAGPALGKILQALLEVVIEDPSRNTRDWLLQEARRLTAGDGS
jgi:tRNA nucleotidyltransferase (CCA-adding enzyme)